MTSRRYDKGESPEIGDEVIVMKGDGPGGRVIEFPADQFVCIQQWYWADGVQVDYNVPILVEPGALLVKEKRTIPSP